MRAITITAPGKSGNIAIAEVPDAAPKAGEILVEVAYAGCNFADVMMARGVYPHPKGYPFVGGVELSGRVAALGPGVTGIAVGDPVAAIAEAGGAFAERCIMPAERALRLPAGMGLDLGAAFPIQALTAWHMLHNVARTKPGDVVLIHAVGGGVGLYLTQLAKRAGATVIGTVGTPGKEKRPLAFGADRVINRADEDFVEAVMAFTKGAGIHKLFDSTGASILDRSMPLLRNLGHIVSFGEAEGRPTADLWPKLVPRSLTFTRFHLGHVDFAGELWPRSVAEVVGGIQQGALKAPIEEVFPFEQAEAMLNRLESRQVGGKLLLAVRLPEAGGRS